LGLVIFTCIKILKVVSLYEKAGIVAFRVGEYSKSLINILN
jgi:hypothetical protein